MVEVPCQVAVYKKTLLLMWTMGLLVLMASCWAASGACSNATAGKRKGNQHCDVPWFYYMLLLKTFALSNMKWVYTMFMLNWSEDLVLHKVLDSWCIQLCKAFVLLDYTFTCNFFFYIYIILYIFFPKYMKSLKSE